MDIKSKWHFKSDGMIPEEGRKIQYVMGPKDVEYGEWMNGQIDYRDGDWEQVIMWKYVDKESEK